MGKGRDSVGHRHDGVRSPSPSPSCLSVSPSHTPPPHPSATLCIGFVPSPEDKLSSETKGSSVLEENVDGWADLEQEIGRAGARGYGYH